VDSLVGALHVPLGGCRAWIELSCEACGSNVWASIEETMSDGFEECQYLQAVYKLVGKFDAVGSVAAEILGDPYFKKSSLPSIGDFPCLANPPKLSSYQVLD
jgi:hypothetical protein